MVVVAAGGFAAFHFIPRPARSGSVANAVAPSASHRSGPLGTSEVTASVPPGASLAPPSSTPSPGTGKDSPVAPAPSPGGLYPYPIDAGATVDQGTLALTPAAVAAGGSATVTVAAPASGWVPGQQIFIYLGQRYEITLSGPGASAQLTVQAGVVGSSGVVVSGFQFPNNNIAAPIDGFGNATLGGQG
ncbi:MAG TPA: hypothetical protein VMW80_11025 [Candidatus Dormibacteraeota bacterium]|nr:hypothetical protein [Candidatus Dormibacteraeota bacterium]